MVVVLRPAQEVELDEPGHRVEVDLTAQPDLLEVGFRAGPHPEAVHRDEHKQSLPPRVVRGPDGIGQKDLT
jgi:hypothetical protein